MEPQTPSTALDPTKVYDTLNLALKIAASIAKLTPTELDDTVVAKLTLVVQQPWFPMFISFLLDLVEKQKEVTSDVVAQAFAEAVSKS